MARVLPPGIDLSTLEKILDHLSDIVGSENVSRDASYGALEGFHGQTNYGDPYATMGKNSSNVVQVPQPSGAVRPGTVDEVQKIVRLANTYKLPLWTVSRGKNLGLVIFHPSTR